MTFAEKVEALGRIYRASVTSWGRTPRRNAAVGGKADSRHLDWLGADLVCDASGDYAQAMVAAERLGLVAVFEGDHLHVQEPKT